jgi:hypothetical protein
MLEAENPFETGALMDKLSEAQTSGYKRSNRKAVGIHFHSVMASKQCNSNDVHMRVFLERVNERTAGATSPKLKCQIVQIRETLRRKRVTFHLGPN